MKEQLLSTANEQLLSTLETSRDYTLAVAEAMPQGDYSFKPVETVWNFGELLNHITYGIEWWEANYVKAIKTDWAPPAVKHGKEEIIADLKKAYDALESTINSTRLNPDAIKGFYATLDHITHHRGQATIYLKCKGIVPPEYVY